jgi:hypothetical protein
MLAAFQRLAGQAQQAKSLEHKALRTSLQKLGQFHDSHVLLHPQIRSED